VDPKTFADLLTEIQRTGFEARRLDLLAELKVCGREPVERITINLGSGAQKREIGQGFWVYVVEGCGHPRPDITFREHRDNIKDTGRFELTPGRVFAWPFAEAIVNVPEGISGTLVLEVARYDVPPPADNRESRNLTAFVTDHLNVTGPGVAVQGPDQAIPHGFALTVKAHPDNGGRIWIGNAELNAENHAVAYPLEPNESVDLRVDNISRLWFDADVSGDDVIFLVEI
jgi:hypothetical protein